jgi:hypothetical protein
MAPQSTASPTTGISDPVDPSRWLVRAWPPEASFCDVVRHFLTAYFGWLQSDRSVARQLAYFEGYQAALGTASTHELTDTAAWQWHDELLACIGECVAIFRDKHAAVGSRTAADIRRLRPAAPATIPARFRPDRAL